MKTKTHNKETEGEKSFGNRISHIVVQCGGRGSRLEAMTENKPKALAPVDNLPIIFHLFKAYPNAHFTIIADYKGDVLEKYLKAFAKVSYNVVRATAKGTASGIRAAIEGGGHPRENSVHAHLVRPDPVECR